MIITLKRTGISCFYFYIVRLNDLTIHCGFYSSPIPKCLLLIKRLCMACSKSLYFPSVVNFTNANGELLIPLLHYDEHAQLKVQSASANMKASASVKASASMKASVSAGASRNERVHEASVVVKI